MKFSTFFQVLGWCRGDGGDEIGQAYNRGFASASIDLSDFERQYVINISRARARGVSA